MGFGNGHFLVCLCLVLFPVSIYSQEFTDSRATYYGSPDCLGTPTGACGFGEYGRTVNDANVAGVSARLFRNGTGCGACYQVRCKVAQCNDEGVRVVATDYGEGDRTDFILSPKAYGNLAQPNQAAELYAYGVVDVEYRRVPCQYQGYNVMFKVHEHSKYPNYLAIVILYQGGMNDILAVQVWQEECKSWVGMRKVYGAVWDMAGPPRGYISVRFQVYGSAGLTWVEAQNALPTEWKAGAAYDSQIQLD